MARSFIQSLLAAAVAVVVGGAALAQDTALQEAVRLLRLNKQEEGVAKLKEILAADPSNADALQLFQSVSQDEWYMLLTSKGEIQQIAQSILERAKVERKQASRDEAAIAALVATATALDSEADYGQRQTAINKLVENHGEFAVPALLAKLADKDNLDGQIKAISALQQLRSAAVLPLIEALKSSDETIAMNAAAALSLIGDDRATPTMAFHANDDRTTVSQIARRFLAKKGVQGGGADLLVKQAGQYLKGVVPFGGYSEVVWKLDGDKLVATDVPQLLYPYELAKAAAADAVRIAPNDLAARSMLAQANLAEANMIESSLAQGDESLRAVEPIASELKITALASGLDAVRAALEAGLAQGLAPVSLGAIEALASAESADTVASSSLLAALGSTDKRVQYAAAEALVKATGGVDVPQAQRVVGVLASAVTEQAVQTIQVISPSLESQQAAEATSKTRGKVVDATSSAVDGMRKLLVNPNTDVVVINENLPDLMPESVIGNIKKDPRMANTRIVIIAKDEAAARARFGSEVGIVMAPLTPESLATAVNTALEGATNPGNARAESYASQASDALLAMAKKKSDIGGAITNLGLQLNRGDSVAVPAAHALGLSGGEPQLTELVAALSGSGSVDLKKASAEAIGNILARLDRCPTEVADALGVVLGSDADVALRRAAAVAVSKAKIDSAAKAELLKKLEKVAAGAKTEG